MAFLAVAGVVAAAALVGGLVLSTAAPTARALPPGPKVVARIPIGHVDNANYQIGGGSLAVGAGAVWAMSDSSSTLMRVDPARNKVVKRIKVGIPGAIAVADRSVWLSNPSQNTVTRLNPGTGNETTIPVGPMPEGLAVSPGAVWVAQAGLFPACRSSVSRIDPATNQVVATIRIGSKGDGCAQTMNLIASRRAVWAPLTNADSIVRIDPAKNRAVATVGVGFQPCGFLAADQAGVWLTAAGCGGGDAPGTLSNVIARVDTRTNKLTASVAEASPAGIAAAFDAVWVAASGNVDQIDPKTAQRVARLHVGRSPDQLGVGFGSLWVNDDTGRVLRIKPQS